MENVTQLANKIEKIVRFVTNKPEGPVALHEPVFIGNEKKYVNDCIDTGWVSSAGEYVNKFEKMLCDFTGAKYAITTVNGTAALHTCLLVAGIEPDHEVLCPALTFVATANAISYCNAVPHFVDIAPDTLGVCPVLLRKHLQEIAVIKNGNCVNKNSGRTIKALVVMHCFGHPAELDELKEVCNDFNLVLIEDAAEAIGSYYKGQHVGNHGLLSCLSFNGNKTITTGGGGAILTNNENLAKRAHHLTTTGKVPHPFKYIHDCIAYNYRMPNINAALGCAQLERLPEILEQKRNLAENFNKLFADIPELTFFKEPPDCKSNYWLNALIIATESALQRDQLISELVKKQIMARPIWQLLNSLPMYKNCLHAKLSFSDKIFARILNLPSALEARQNFLS
jgi:perosamine synthetase